MKETNLTLLQMGHHHIKLFHPDAHCVLSPSSDAIRAAVGELAQRADPSGMELLSEVDLPDKVL